MRRRWILIALGLVLAGALAVGLRTARHDPWDGSQALGNSILVDAGATAPIHVQREGVRCPDLWWKCEPLSVTLETAPPSGDRGPLCRRLHASLVDRTHAVTAVPDLVDSRVAVCRFSAYLGAGRQLYLSVDGDILLVSIDGDDLPWMAD